MAGLSTLRSFNGFFVQNETPFWNGCHLDSQNVQTSPSQISLIKKSVHTHVQYILTSLLYQKERHHSPQQQYHCSKDNCRRDQITTKTVYTLLGYTFRLALISDFHLIFFLLTYSVLSGGRKVRFFFVAADLVDLVFLSWFRLKITFWSRLIKINAFWGCFLWFICEITTWVNKWSVLHMRVEQLKRFIDSLSS